ncbi:MAG: 2-C-methyl-D-erythritol 4-phosphate cytidylyltransferase [Gammaproteobacteria bacterium]|nr:2-C-methyl-D-erythritol 4-phosphate cytidylyltransferase [Gammaproteobacteria bacterium]
MSEPAKRTAPPSRRVFAILPAAGRGERFAPGAALPKQYHPLRGRALIEWSIERLLAEPRIETLVVVVAPGDPHWPALAARHAGPRLRTATGGASRQESVANGLASLEGLAAAEDPCLVHDAARPCLGAREIADLLAEIDRGAPGAVLAAPVVDTIKREHADGRIETVDRNGLWRALTPQVFRYGRLREALAAAAAAGVAVTDEAQAMERLGESARLVAGSPFNIKVTRPEDLQTAARILGTREADRMRIGQGFDVHTFGEGDHVVLGGVRIAHTRGVIAHSDGDVVIHALCDALLGALGQGDIGEHFPDSDPRYRGADSRTFLREVAARMRAAGYALINADVTVLAEAPRIARHRGTMAEHLAADLGVPRSAINVKATTTERLGFVGRGEGLAASATVLLSAGSGPRD